MLEYACVSAASLSHITHVLYFKVKGHEYHVALFYSTDTNHIIAHLWPSACVGCVYTCLAHVALFYNGLALF